MEFLTKDPPTVRSVINVDRFHKEHIDCVPYKAKNLKACCCEVVDQVMQHGKVVEAVLSTLVCVNVHQFQHTCVYTFITASGDFVFKTE